MNMNFRDVVSTEWDIVAEDSVGKVLPDDFADQLDEGFLVENYISQAAQTEADRAIAEKLFKMELTNGPSKQITYSSGRTYQKKVGSLDLENLHKAYDEWYDDNSLLGLFDSDGKLLNRRTYAEIKSFDKKIPAVSALLKLWGAQFSGDMPFKQDKDRAERAKQLGDEFRELKIKVRDALRKIPELQKLKDAYENKIDRPTNDIDIVVEEAGSQIMTAQLSDPKSLIETEYDLLTRLNGIFMPPNKVHLLDIYTHVDIGMDADQIIDVIKPELVKAINRATAIGMAALLIVENYRTFVELLQATPAYRFFYQNIFEWSCWYDPATSKYYKAESKTTVPVGNGSGGNRTGLMLSDVENPNNRAIKFTKEMRLVAVKLQDLWTDDEVFYYVDNLISPNIAGKLHMPMNQSTAAVMGYSDMKITDADEEFAKYFTTKIVAEK